MSKSALFFDIGNTNTKIGLAGSTGSVVSYVLPTNERQTADQFGLTLLELLRHMDVPPGEVDGALASSVVPGMGQIVRRACKRFLDIELRFAPEDLPVPLENRYARPHEVGADRLVGAYAARRLYPEASSIITVDYGTATTFDCVEGNAYLGGLICPGLLSSVGALASGTAKLPRFSLEISDTEPRPGRSTATSLNHGFVFGFAAMTEGLIARLSRTMQRPVLTIGTGGFAASLAEVTNCFSVVISDLLLEGLRFLYFEQSAG